MSRFQSGGIVKPGPLAKGTIAYSMIAGEWFYNKRQLYNLHRTTGILPKCYRARTTFKLKHYIKRQKKA